MYKVAINPQYIINLIEEELSLSKIVEDVDYIQLETTSDGVLIGEVRIMKVFDNEYYMLDPHLTRSLYVFDSIGNIKFKINDFGRGPLEYSSIMDFTIIPEDNELLIYDDKGSKLIFYNLNNGKAVREQKLYYRISNIDYNHKSSIILFSGIDRDNAHLPLIDMYQAYITDKNFVIKSAFSRKHDYDKNRYNRHTYQYSIGSNIFFIPRFKNKVYKVIDSASVELKYKLIFDDFEADKNYYINSSESFFDYIELNKDKYYFMGSFLDTKIYSLFNLMHLISINMYFLIRRTHLLNCLIIF